MSLKRIILASVATMFAANVAHAADLNLFGYEEKEGTTATTILDVVNINPVATMEETALFNQQAVGEDTVKSSLTASTTSGTSVTLTSNGTGPLANTETQDAEGTSTVASYTMETQLLSVSNSAMNAMNSFNADNTNIANLYDDASTVQAPALVNQQAVANGSTDATMTLTEIVTTGTNISNSAIGAVNNINLTTNVATLP